VATSTSSKRLIVVLGMHRSGTSALTRWLGMAGVELGDKLLRPESDNPTGFWEDRRIVALNDRLLSALDLSWHSVAPVDLTALPARKLSTFRARARKLLQALTFQTPVAAFKDPRTARLLPFWQPLFDEMDLSAEFLVVVRHPFSVMDSLERRHGFTRVKSELLWLGHVMPVLPRIWESTALVVDFDRWVDDTATQADRIRRAFKVPRPADLDAAVGLYRDDFLSAGLRHSKYPDNACSEGAALDELLPRVWQLLSDLATDRRSLTDPSFRADWQLLESSWSHTADVLTALAHEELRADRSIQALAEAQGELDRARQDAGQIRAQLGGELDKSRNHSANLGERIGRTEEELARVRDQLAARSKQLEQSQNWSFIAMEELRGVNRTVVLTRQHATNLESQVETLRAGLADARKQESKLEAASESLRSELDATRTQLEVLSTELNHIKQSTAWRATGPARRLVQWLRVRARTLRRRRVKSQYVPLHDVQEQGALWRAIGEDPQFLLETPGVRISSGWILFECKMLVPRDIRTRPMLYLDLGEGFSEKTAKPLPEPRQGRLLGVLALPQGVRRIRFDPVDGQLDFGLEAPTIREIGRVEAGLRIAWLIYRSGLGAGLRPKDMFSRLVLHWRGGGLTGVVRRLLSQYGNGAAPAVGLGAGQIGYPDWTTRYEHLHAEDLAAMRNAVNDLSWRPVISVVMPVFNTPELLLRRAIESVIHQVYPHWELCVADDASTVWQVRSILSEYAQRDDRIKLVFREHNGHISEATNSALERVSGEFIALLDHDDELAPHALYLAALEANRHPDTQIMYSDEDKIDEQGRRFDPHFKPDWNPDLFFSQNYVSHLGIYRTDLVRCVGGMRPGLEGSQDYDLCLRCVARCGSEQIRHIPHVLYHWRAIPGSTALATEAKSYPERAGIRALEDHLATIDADVAVEPGRAPTTYRLVYPLPDPPPLVSLVIPTRNGHHVLRQAVSSIVEKTTYACYEILIVDNESDDAETLDYLRGVAQSPNIRILHYERPFNFSAINNFAVQHCNGTVIGLINNDVEVIDPGWLDEMVRHALRPEVGAVGAKLLYGNGQVQHAGIVLGIGGVAGHGHKHFSRMAHGYFSRLDLVHDVGGVTAACMVVRKSLYEAVNGFNEDALTVAFNDVDFCLKLLEAGYRNVWTPYALLYHHESVSRGPEDTPAKQARFRAEVEWMRKRWGGRLLHDPAYSPNLTLEREDFSLATPPRVDCPWHSIHGSGTTM